MFPRPESSVSAHASFKVAVPTKSRCRHSGAALARRDDVKGYTLARVAAESPEYTERFATWTYSSRVRLAVSIISLFLPMLPAYYYWSLHKTINIKHMTLHGGVRI